MPSKPVTILTHIAILFVIYNILGVSCNNVRILRCCFGSEKSIEKLDNVIRVEDERYFLRDNSSNPGTFANKSDNFTIEASKCHSNEAGLSINLSIYPSQIDIGFLPDGYLQNGIDLHSPEEYCIIKNNVSSLSVKIKAKTSCEGSNCLRKCCEPQEVFDFSTYGVSKLLCVPSLANPWKPVVHSLVSYEVITDATSGVLLKSDHPRNWCSDNIVIWSMKKIGTDRKSLFRILNNGSVVKRDGIYWREMNTSNICIDGAVNIPGTFDPVNKHQAFSGNELDTIIMECGPKLAEDEAEYPTLLYGAALSISSLFLVAIIIVYGLLWDKQNIHGWTLLGYVTSMLLFYIALIATFVYLYKYSQPYYVNETEIFTSFCGVIAVITHFLYICTTCWLTVISFDIFSKFRILKLTGTRSKNQVKFIMYLIFTIAVPSIIVGIAVILDVSYGDDLEINIILPRYGWNKCFIDLEYAALPYLFAPVGVLLIINCILYLTTIFHIHKLQESTKFASASSSSIQVQKQRAKIRLFSKLFLLMGITWIFEFVSFLVFGANSNIITIIGDLINILQPVLVFIIFVCKRDILESVCQKYSSISKFFSSVEPEDSTDSTASNNQRNAARRLTWAGVWNPVSTSTTKWFRARINSTMTDTSNISNQSTKSNYANEASASTHLTVPTIMN
ncbi:unnamed protein product [Orchesella dallaii]|uniref:G-protein coupled receptors family 2 profile 2 domain-containing protein n=1 Tax=Orchesella dallaii TaxID=48710 RepID=A0ABP1R8F8_9HEXA